MRVRARSHKHLHGASGQLAAGVGSVGGGVAVAMGGVWVTSEATALIDATLTLVRINDKTYLKRRRAAQFQHCRAPHERRGKPKARC